MADTTEPLQRLRKRVEMAGGIAAAARSQLDQLVTQLARTLASIDLDDEPQTFTWPTAPHIRAVTDRTGTTWYLSDRDEWACDNDTWRTWPDLLRERGPLTEVREPRSSPTGRVEGLARSVGGGS